MVHQRLSAFAGSFILLVGLAACSSAPHARTTADYPDRRVAADDRSPHDPTDRMQSSNRMTATDDRLAAATERPVPSDRLGSGDRRTSDRVVPCADNAGDTTTSLDCAPGSRDRARDRTAAVAGCPTHTDARGNIVYDDPSCPTRAVPGCPSHTDARGNIVYDDPSCPSRNQRPMGSSYQNVRWTQENAFYDRHAEKAVKHAREAEIAANQGHVPEMLHHTELSLERAKEAQRAGNHPDLNDGITDLRQVLALGQNNDMQAARSTIRDARIRLSKAAGIKTVDTRTSNEWITPTSAGASSRTVKGELLRSRNPSRMDGGEHYVVRDQHNREVPISLSSDMSAQVHEGDMVEAQLDSQGRVVAISKYQ